MTDQKAAEGLRERKRRETRQRITNAGMQLFAANGFEATTLDAIAAAAGISRRTFFHYFKSKDDILLSMQSGLGESLVVGLAEQPEGQSPLRTMQAVMIGIASQYSLEELGRIDRIMRASEAVQARKQASYIGEEAVVLAALRARWPEESDMALRLVALLSVGMARLSIDAWTQEGGKRPLADLVREAFTALETNGRV